MATDMDVEKNVGKTQDEEMTGLGQDAPTSPASTTAALEAANRQLPGSCGPGLGQDFPPPGSARSSSDAGLERDEEKPRD